MLETIKQINRQGQLSVEKKFSGSCGKIPEYEDGSILLTPVEIVTKLEARLLSDPAFAERLDRFDGSAGINRAKTTNIERLEI
jgi:hypothetical protein